MATIARALLLLLLAALLPVVAAATDPLLLIVGSVTSTQARILYDLPPPSSPLLAQDLRTELHVRVLVSTSAAPGTRNASHAPVVHALERELRVHVSPHTSAPRVLALSDLKPNRMYSVGFRLVQQQEQEQEQREQEHPIDKHTSAATTTTSSSSEELVTFRTLVSPETSVRHVRAASDRVLVVSCDRYVDDRDDTLWHQIIADMDAHGASYFGMAHIGDQVYVDAGKASIPIVPVPRALARKQPALLRAHYDAIVAQFRSIYRQTYGRRIVQRALRSGAHWMVPDDHEVINNVNWERVQRVFAAPESAQEGDEAETEAAQRRGLALHYRAGLQVYYEFQYQLHADFPFSTVDFLDEPSLAAVVARFPMFFAVDVHDLRLLFLDLRFDRSFFHGHDDRTQLIGPAQMAFLDRQLARSNDSSEDTVVVLSSVPLFFHSTLSAAITYAVERETYPGLSAQLPGLAALFDRFVRHRAVRLLVGGDVHCLAHTHVCSHATRCIDQLVTSGVTRGSTAVQDLKLVPFYYLIARLTPLVALALAWWPSDLPSWHIAFERLYLGRNYGVLELAPDGTFEWRSSVVAPHESAFEDALQARWAMDVSSARVAWTFAVVFVTGAFVLRARRR